MHSAPSEKELLVSDCPTTACKKMDPQSKEYQSAWANVLASLVTGEPEYAGLQLYKSNTLRYLLYLAASLVTIGILPLFTTWYPSWYILLTHVRTDDVDQADSVLIQSNISSNQWEPSNLQRFLCDGTKWFAYRQCRYVCIADVVEDASVIGKYKFLRLRHELKESLEDTLLRLQQGGFSSAAASARQDIYGPNTLVLPPQPTHRVLLNKILHPFYLFQAATVIIWFHEQYTTYAVVILVLSVMSILWEVIQQVGKDKSLHRLASVDDNVTVLRDGINLCIAAQELVAGDIVVLEAGYIAADMLVLRGECIADESTLTGESIPIQKTPLLGQSSDFIADSNLKDSSKRNCLYGGSTILKLKTSPSISSLPNDRPQENYGVVLSAGFSTNKGQLFRTILFPAPIKFQIQTDSYRFLWLLCCVATLAFARRLIQAYSNPKVGISDAIVSSLDLVTIAVPPALPLILTIGVGFALSRLNENQIACIDSQRINLAGHVNCICFDKTGTLSSDHLNFQGVDECNTSPNSSSAAFVGLQIDVEVLNLQTLVGLATCHNIELDSQTGKLNGYALEVDMFEATGYFVGQDETTNHLYPSVISSPVGKSFGVLLRCGFDAAIQRSSVLIEDVETGIKFVYTKGSPESVSRLCIPASIPSNFADKVRLYSCQGLYCMALAYKTYPDGTESITREKMESGLTLLGLILFVNPVAEDASYVISTLEEDAMMDVRIITGDHALTAIHLAKKVNLQMEGTILLFDVDQAGDSTARNIVIADVERLTNPLLASASISSMWMPFEPSYFLPQTDTSVAQTQQETYAVTGQALSRLSELYGNPVVEELIIRTKIFARISPTQKAYIVEVLSQRGGKIIAMVGDGTNDCGALKAAHIGLSLSTADASLVAPFTSQKKKLIDIIQVLREGRGALSTTFVAFQYMVMYSLIQLISCEVLMEMSAQLSDRMFLVDDLVIVFLLSCTMVRTKASHRLTKRAPPHSLFAPSIVLSLFGQLLLGSFALIIALNTASAQSEWFCSAAESLNLTLHSSSEIHPPCYLFQRSPSAADLTNRSYESSIVWVIGHWQYWMLAISFNLQTTFRQSLQTNRYFLLALFIVMGVIIIILKDQEQDESEEMNVTNSTHQPVVRVSSLWGGLQFPSTFGNQLILLCIGELLLSVLWEMLFINGLVHQWEEQKIYSHSTQGHINSVRAGSFTTKWNRFTRNILNFFALGTPPLSVVADRDQLLEKKKSNTSDNVINLRVNSRHDNDKEEDVEIEIFAQNRRAHIGDDGYV